jgi:exosortase B
LASGAPDTPSQAPLPAANAFWRAWLPLALIPVGLVLLYVPTFRELVDGLWRSDQHSHGPVVLAVTIWLFARRLVELFEHRSAAQPAPLLGWPVLLLGLTLYVIGRSQSFPALDVASLTPVVLGCTLILLGRRVAVRLWFVFLFMLFLIPLPGSLIDVMTQPMKIAVSWATEQLLHAAGYAVSRAGVVLNIGQYQLLVADACSGLNSLFMLEAFGLLYLNLVRHQSPLRNLVLAILIVPISFAANVTRVIVLALLTFHRGDEAGQGFMHAFSGLVLFVAALLFIVLGDALLRAAARRSKRAR